MRRFKTTGFVLLIALVGFSVLGVRFLVHAGPSGAVALHELADRVEITIDGKPFTAYYFAATQAKPYFHPLRAPSGKSITRGYPMIPDVKGETHDHPHQRGAWFTHGDVDGVNFWAEGPAMGREVHRRFERVESGPAMGRLTDQIDWVTPAGKIMLDERRAMIIRSQPEARIIDFEITLRPKDRPVTFRDTKEGAFGLRLTDALTEKGIGKIRNSEGGVGEKQTWGKRARWVDYSGALDGEPLGVAIFDHPSNLRHPTYWHVRGYGLFAANPFGVRDFTGDKQQDGSYTLKPGDQLVFRYRVYVHSRDLSLAQIETQYKAYTMDTSNAVQDKRSKKGRS
jgi:hypothetical protein